MTGSIELVGAKRLRYRAGFSEEALENECLNVYEELKNAEDPYDQEIFWGQWTDCFFKDSNITWVGLASIPLLQQILLRDRWYDKRPVWEYLLFMASHVERIYFYYDRHPGPDYLSEESRWKDVWRREEARPWLRLAFHACREFVPMMEQLLPHLSKAEKEFAYKLLWLTISFRRKPLHAQTREELQNWACTYLRIKDPGHTLSNHNQLGLFQA
ncbi:MAG: hypothetical protein AAFY71_01550 [Bacteroidota bacterium]